MSKTTLESQHYYNTLGQRYLGIFLKSICNHPFSWLKKVIHHISWYMETYSVLICYYWKSYGEFNQNTILLCLFRCPSYYLLPPPLFQFLGIVKGFILRCCSTLKMSKKHHISDIKHFIIDRHLIAQIHNINSIVILQYHSCCGNRLLPWQRYIVSYAAITLLNKIMS